MAEWNRVKWFEAGQVVALTADDDTPAELEWSLPPEKYVSHLRSTGRLEDAVRFMGQALPRLEAVAWAARSVRDMRQVSPVKPAEARALRSALLWVSDPSEARRSAAHEAAEECNRASPERLVAMAAFFSGGSIAPINCPPVPAPRQAAGQFASGAVLSAAARSADRPAALEGALEAAGRIAQEGVSAASE